MNNKIYFAMGLHFHQPVGNFDKILERAYQNCYRPFMDIFARYPDIKMTFHFSGNLLDYFEDNHPEFLDDVRRLVDLGQVEIMSGGYYEPVFQAIPQQDRIGQIRMLSDYAETRFGTRPHGIWTPERVWSPDLASDFHSCGARYSILDNEHLIKAGVSHEDMYGYFTTGPTDNKIAIFPSDIALRYLMPFRPPRETIDYFRRVAKKRYSPLFIYGDDGEKFGEWPWTYDWVYKKGWLNKFFNELVKAKDWIDIVTFSEYLDSHPPVKDVHIPEASYEEMLEWSEGSWMNFLSKYPESDQMHKRMTYVSRRISELDSNSMLDDAKRELYKGQCNCSYWHGVFGGIYLHHLRNAVYEHLIKADRVIDEIEHGTEDNWMNAREIDFYDKHIKTIILENKNFFICIDPADGGAIRELDYKTKSSNLINTLARRKEFYHKKILERINNERTVPVSIHEAIKTMDTRIKKELFYDTYNRSCLLDHFIDKDLKKEDFSNGNYVDTGDFAASSYVARIEKQKAILSREGKVKGRIISLTKEISISSDTQIKISYFLKNKDVSNIDTLFGMEFNVTMPCADSERYSYESNKENLGGLDKQGSVSGMDYFLIKDCYNDLGLQFVFSKQPEKIWYFPVMTVSQSERAYDLNYQSSCIFPVWGIGLKPGEEIKLDIDWKMA